MRIATPPTWPAALRSKVAGWAGDADERLDAAWRRLDGRLRRDLPQHIAAYRGYADEQGAQLFGRVLAQAPQGGPGEDDNWWDNLLNTYRRFQSDEVPHAAVTVRFRGADAEVRTDGKGYYSATVASTLPASTALWENAAVSLENGALATVQPVLQVRAGAGFGVISDIDDTILHSSINDWKTAAQLTFMHNARTRKPLEGVARLYQALQLGGDGSSLHPIFYVSSSPWNLYDLIDDFMELNAIPCGPMFLRDLGTAVGKVIKSDGHRHKLERTRELIGRFPALRWVLLGDSGQADAELYAEAAREFGNRISAIYIRDVDPDADSPLDLRVDGHIQRVSGTTVPMLRVRDSLAIAEHAASLGLIDPKTIDPIALEVRRDRARPTLGEAVVTEALSPDSGSDA